LLERYRLLGSSSFGFLRGVPWNWGRIRVNVAKRTRGNDEVVLKVADGLGRGVFVRFNRSERECLMKYQFGSV
jgi:hypothetical protein